MTYLFVLGFFVGGVVTLFLLKGLLLHCRSDLNKAAATWQKAARELHRAVERNEEAIEIRREAIAVHEEVMKIHRQIKLKLQQQ